ncbi:Hypothetical protein NTJ_02985 [Nesidiocoris tenuis]|uniref:Uncharacterized protein n=1 Tax=Nesidiocoris tenuis TaxID=355587 RepID=A0ABN7ACZ8_9HEMI|nr:Hypothetical protein NTJ_02985 [Nesidiocoris tenuis]
MLRWPVEDEVESVEETGKPRSLEGSAARKGVSGRLEGSPWDLDGFGAEKPFSARVPAVLTGQLLNRISFFHILPPSGQNYEFDFSHSCPYSCG